MESQIVDLVNGSRAYGYDLELERIACNNTLSHFSFRSGGSSGANATADWLVSQFEIMGLDVHKEQFNFTSWEVLSKPQLVIDDDGNFNTTSDQVSFDSFLCEHYSWPTSPGGAFADLVVLPLPPASSYSQIGVYPINTTAWNAVDTTGKIVLIGREVRWVGAWESAWRGKIASQTPAAVVYCLWYDWESFSPAWISSIGGRPASGYGPYYWNLKIPVGSLGYSDGLWIRNRETSVNVSAFVKIEALIGTGPHYNVVGKLVGKTYPNKFIIVSSHYDSVMDSGFCDNGAGTAGVLELARVFSEANASGLLVPRYTILFIPWTDEELSLVGATNYVIQHKAEMRDIVAVLNLDCIGSDNMRVTDTVPGPRFDLDQMVYRAAQDLGIGLSSEPPGGSDQDVFLYPAQADSDYFTYWGLNGGIADAAAVESSVLLISYPLMPRDKFLTGEVGWIHTPYDNSTSTAALNWVETGDLENQIRVTALSVTRIARGIMGDVDDNGRVDMGDMVELTKAFGSTLKPDGLYWHKEPCATCPHNASNDIDGNGRIDMSDVIVGCRNFGRHYS